MKTILLIEDQMMLHGIYKTALETCRRCFSWPVEILTASTFEDADSIITAGGIDCVILDLTLPGSPRENTISEIPNRRVNWKIPIVVLTGALDDECRVQCIRGGADDFCTKDVLQKNAWVLMEKCYNAYLRFNQNCV